MKVPELSGVTVVGAGSFNPAIVHPLWLAEKKLMPENVAEYAVAGGEQPLLVSPKLTSFVADWLTVQITQQQAVFSTVDKGRELDLRDLARGFFELLPETPVDAVGINADYHFRADDETTWHAFGDRFLPKDFWEPLFQGDEWKTRSGGNRVGMRVMTVEVHRKDDLQPGYVRIELAPSVRAVPNGVYIGINAHFQLTREARRATAAHAARVLVEQWEGARKLETGLLGSLEAAV
jgi:hypothetical protein